MIQKSISLMGLFFLITFLFSCEKELKCENSTILDGELGFMVGEWKLSYVARFTSHDNGAYIKDTIYANEITNDYFLTFKEKGKLELRKDNEIVNEECIYLSEENINFSVNPINIKFEYPDLDQGYFPTKFFSFDYYKNSDFIRIYQGEYNFPYSNYSDEYKQVTFNHVFVVN